MTFSSLVFDFTMDSSPEIPPRCTHHRIPTSSTHHLPSICTV